MIRELASWAAGLPNSAETGGGGRGETEPGKGKAVAPQAPGAGENHLCGVCRIHVVRADASEGKTGSVAPREPTCPEPRGRVRPRAWSSSAGTPVFAAAWTRHLLTHRGRGCIGGLRPAVPEAHPPGTPVPAESPRGSGPCHPRVKAALVKRKRRERRLPLRAVEMCDEPGEHSGAPRCLPDPQGTPQGERLPSSARHEDQRVGDEDPDSRPSPAPGAAVWGQFSNRHRNSVLGGSRAASTQPHTAVHTRF